MLGGANSSAAAPGSVMVCPSAQAARTTGRGAQVTDDMKGDRDGVPEWPAHVPDRVLRAMAAPMIDHRGPAFAALARQVLADLGWLCGTARLVPDEGYRATGRVFRIGHLGDLGDVSPAGARCGGGDGARPG